jgi:hypothetical protein
VIGVEVVVTGFPRASGGDGGGDQRLPARQEAVIMIISAYPLTAQEPAPVVCPVNTAACPVITVVCPVIVAVCPVIAAVLVSLSELVVGRPVVGAPRAVVEACGGSSVAGRSMSAG